jgi:Mg-chelatase subunit ChlD
MKWIGDDTRAASEVLGTVLLVGLVLAGAVVTVMLGTSAIEGAQQQNDVDQAKIVIQDVDSELTSLTQSADSTRLDIDFGDTNPRNYQLATRGQLNLTVDERAGCSVTLPLRSLRFEDKGGTVAYEAGGVWTRDDTNGSGMVTRPSLTNRGGTIDITLVNLSGTPDQSQNDLKYDVSTSRTLSSQYANDLTTGDCTRPNNVTLAVQSDFYRAWGNYLETEFGVESTVDHANRTVEIRLESPDLPTRVDDERNQVVNITDPTDPPGYMKDVSIDETSDPPEIMIDKGVDNTYAVTVRPLHQDTPPVGNITEVSGSTQVDRPPLDVMFVLDESGSMSQTDSDGKTRSEEAKAASKLFVDGLNESKDRAGVVSYDSNPGGSEYRLSDKNEYISPDHSSTGVNGSIEDIPDNPSGGTESQLGMRKANHVFDLQSNESRQKIMILLTDGVNDDCQVYDPSTGWQPGPETNNGVPNDCDDNNQSLARARNAANNGVTIYTVGYGGSSQIDEAFLQEVADITGGTFYQATNAADLEDVFDDIRRSITRTRVVTRSPFSANVTTAGQVFGPQVPGSDDHVAATAVGGHQFKNLNDPTTSSTYSYRFAASGGDDVTIEAYDYECASDGWSDTGRAVAHNGTTFTVARCTDIISSRTISPDDIFTDGDTLPAEIHTDVNYSEVWQADINRTFAAQPDVGLNTTTGELDLESNQAIVYYDLPDGPNGESVNYLLLRYEIGLAESDVRGVGAVNIDIRQVAFEV